MSVTRKRSSEKVMLGMTVIAASSLSGCAGDQPDYSAICVDPQTQQRVSDRDCSRDSHPTDWDGVSNGFFWYYIGTQSGGRIPAVGQTYSPGLGSYRGSKYVSSGKTIQRGGLPAKGAPSFKSFTKSGGFGSSKGVSSS